MQYRSFAPDSVTFICILKACTSIGAVAKGEEIHAQIVKAGLVGNHQSRALGNALIDMYLKCGSLVKAEHVFDEIHLQDVISWTTLISGYVRHGHGERAIEGFERMQIEAISADAVMLVHALKACGIVGTIIKGEQIHARIIAERLLEQNVVMGNALVDMYAKCGALTRAQMVFDTLPFRDVVSWNALISGYAQLGRDEIVFKLFDRMIDESKEPTLVTFTAVLNACSHAGLLEKGQIYFETMKDRYRVNPTLEHYTCMIDLFGRAGYIDQAAAMIKEMPFPADLTVWLALLGACQKWQNVVVGSWAFGHAIRLDAEDAAAYVCMINLYTGAGMHVEARRIEALRIEMVQ
jgi:pentatricopeptide repeat protein